MLWFIMFQSNLTKYKVWIFKMYKSHKNTQLVHKFKANSNRFDNGIIALDLDQESLLLQNTYKCFFFMVCRLGELLFPLKRPKLATNLCESHYTICLRSTYMNFVPKHSSRTVFVFCHLCQKPTTRH